MPDFTIITPVLNQAEHIEKCILSVLEQGVNVQHIIMDGGSTDGTVDVIRTYENQLSYWESKPDEGQSDAINKGLKRATGRFFNWLNADDQLTPNALKNVLTTASQQTQVVIGQCEHIDETGNRVAIGGARIWDSMEATLGNYSMGQPSVFYQTAVIHQLGELNAQLHYCMDMDLWFRYLARFGQQHIATTDVILSQFLVHPDSKSVKDEELMRHEKYAVYHAFLSQFPLPAVLKQFFVDFPIPNVEMRAYLAELDQKELLANFCWHLLLKAYEKSEVAKSRAYFDIVKNGRRFTAIEKLKWQGRLAAIQFGLR